MRINESFSAPVPADRTDRTGAAGQDAAGSSRGTSSEDLVSLSGSADLISRALTSGSDARAARIQSIAAQVNAGTYQVSADTLAESMVGSMMAGY